MDFEIKTDLPAPHAYMASNPRDNYALRKGQPVEIVGDGFIPGTLRVRPGPDCDAREVPSHVVGLREQGELL